MFAERIYLKAYQRGVFTAAEKFCSLYTEGRVPDGSWPFAKTEATTLVRDLAEDGVMLRRLTALAYAGARNEWRHLSEALRRRSGIFLRVGAVSQDDEPPSAERVRAVR
jgi:hypothetical protein